VVEADGVGSGTAGLLAGEAPPDDGVPDDAVGGEAVADAAVPEVVGG
jgi:hypothetical protein